MTGTHPPAQRRSWADTWTAPAIVGAAAVVALAPSLGGGFVADDQASVLDNAVVMRPGSVGEALAGAFRSDPFGYTRPLRTIEFAADVALFGPGATAFRVHSLLWHVAACVLLVFVLRRLLGDPRAAFAAALFWAVHPANVEPVAWISARGDVAMGACALASVLFALRSDGLDRWLAASLAAAAVATLYKETAVLLPGLVLVLRWTKLCRAPAWPYFVVAGAYAAWRVVSKDRSAPDVGFVLGGTAVGTWGTMSRAFGFYVVETLLPAESFDWYMPPSTTFDAAATAWLVVHGALVWSAISARRRAPLWTLGVAWFYGFLLPVSNVIVNVGKPTSERYMYLSLVGAAVAVGWAVVHGRRVFAAALVAAAAFGVQSFVRAETWVGDDARYSAVLASRDGSPGARYYFAFMEANAATTLVRQAQSTADGPERSETTSRARAAFERSLDHVHRAIAIWRAYDPSSPPKSRILRRFEVVASSDCYRLLRWSEALFHAEQALLIDPTLDAFGEYDRAMPLLALGFAGEAAAAMKRARKLGFGQPSEEIGGFFLRAALKCEEDGLRAAAEDCYASAVEASPEGPIRRDAETRLFALRGRPWSDAQAADERAKAARLDDELARLPRTCPDRK